MSVVFVGIAIAYYLYMDAIFAHLKLIIVNLLAGCLLFSQFANASESDDLLRSTKEKLWQINQSSEFIMSKYERLRLENDEKKLMVEGNWYLLNKRFEKNLVLYQDIKKIDKKVSESSEVKVNESYSVKLLTSVLRGKMTLKIVNPFLNLNFDSYITGKNYFIAHKMWEDVDMDSGVRYELNKKEYISYLSKNIYPNLNAQFSFMRADKRLELNLNILP